MGEAELERKNDVPSVSRRSAAPDAMAPDGSEIRLLVDWRQGAGRASLCEVTLPPEQVSRPVSHRGVEEIWYILEGHGRVWRCPPGVEAGAVAPIEVAPGDALTIPPRWRFQFSSGASAPLRFLCLTSPPWPGAGEAELAETGGLGTPTL